MMIYESVSKGWACPACGGAHAPWLVSCPVKPDSEKTLGERMRDANELRTLDQKGRNKTRIGEIS